MRTSGRGGLDGRVAALVVLLSALFLGILLYYVGVVLGSLPNPIPTG